MKIEYVARKATLTDQDRQLAEKKLGKIRKYFNDILDVRVEVDQERHLYVADLFVKGKDFDLGIGTGPFKFVKYVSGSHIIMERFDDYWAQSPMWTKGY